MFILWVIIWSIIFVILAREFKFGNFEQKKVISRPLVYTKCKNSKAVIIVKAASTVGTEKWKAGWSLTFDKSWPFFFFVFSARSLLDAAKKGMGTISMKR